MHLPSGLNHRGLNMICILLTKGQYAIIDNDDWDAVSKYKWQVNEYRPGKFRAYARESRKLGHKMFYMHRFILGVEDGSVHVDHIDGNPLNNTRTNLRTTDNAHNRYNSPKPSTNTSGYKGVSFSKVANKWHAYISFEKQRLHLGLFVTKEEAHEAYCAAAATYHGEFANTGL